MGIEHSGAHGVFGQLLVANGAKNALCGSFGMGEAWDLQRRKTPTYAFCYDECSSFFFFIFVLDKIVRL